MPGNARLITLLRGGSSPEHGPARSPSRVLVPGMRCPGRRMAPRARRLQSARVCCGASPGLPGRVCISWADDAGAPIRPVPSCPGRMRYAPRRWRWPVDGHRPAAPSSWRLTAALFEAIAADDGLLEQLAVLPPDRLPALLASAAVAFLVRRDRPVPLASYFPEPGGSQPRFDDGFFPAFRRAGSPHLRWGWRSRVSPGPRSPVRRVDPMAQRRTCAGARGRPVKPGLPWAVNVRAGEGRPAAA